MKATQIKPCSDRVLLKGIEKNPESPYGIELPQSANKERPYMYEVLAVWPGKYDNNGKIIPLDIKPGEKVFSWQYSGDDIKFLDENGKEIELKIVGAEYILAVVND